MSTFFAARDLPEFPWQAGRSVRPLARLDQIQEREYLIPLTLKWVGGDEELGTEGAWCALEADLRFRDREHAVRVARLESAITAAKKAVRVAEHGRSATEWDGADWQSVQIRPTDSELEAGISAIDTLPGLEAELAAALAPRIVGAVDDAVRAELDAVRTRQKAERDAAMAAGDLSQAPLDIKELVEIVEGKQKGRIFLGEIGSVPDLIWRQEWTATERRARHHFLGEHAKPWAPAVIARLLAWPQLPEDVRLWLQVEVTR